jgi:hypothetical protein
MLQNVSGKIIYCSWITVIVVAIRFACSSECTNEFTERGIKFEIKTTESQFTQTYSHNVLITIIIFKICWIFHDIVL